MLFLAMILAASSGTSDAAPNRFRQVVSGFPVGRDDTIIIGHEVYGSDNGAPWSVQTLDDHLVTGFESDVFAVEILSVGDYRTTAGKTVGTFAMKDPLGEKKDDALSCTYEKITFRPLACSNAAKTLASTDYDSPSVYDRGSK